MRILIYAMQSSGASTLAFLLGQHPACSAFVDIWTMYAAPALPGTDDVVAKVVVTTSFPLALHQERFRPDRTILFLRHPGANYRSLASKSYKNHCGFIEEKFILLDQIFSARSDFDSVLYYEDLIFNPEKTLQAVADLGWPCDPGFLRMPRNAADMIAANQRRYPFLADRLQYGIGKYRIGKLTAEFADLIESPDADADVGQLCPELTAHYQYLLRNNGGKWRLSAA